MPRAADQSLAFIPFIPGQREDIKQLAPPGTLVTASNVRYDLDRISGRPGSIAVPPTVQGTVHPIVGGQSIGLIARVGDTNVMGVDGKLYARDEVANIFDMAGAYSTTLPLRQRNSLPAGPQVDLGGTRAATAVSSDGYLLGAGVVTNIGPYYFLESPSGARVAFGQLSAGGTKVAACAQGTTLILVVQNGANLDLYSFAIASGVVTCTRTLAWRALASGAHYWDLSGYDSSSWMLVSQTGAAQVTLQANNGATSINTTTFACTGICPLSVWGDAANTRVWVGIYDDVAVTGGVKWRAYTWSGSAFAAFTNGTLYSAANIYGPPLFGVGPSGYSALFVVQISQRGTSPFLRGLTFGHMSIAGALSYGPFDMYHASPISKPDNKGRVWCITGNESTNWHTQRVVMLRVPAPGGPFLSYPTIELACEEQVAPLQTTHLPSRAYDYFHATAIGSDRHYFTAPNVLSQGPGSNEFVAQQVLEYAPAEMRPHRQAQEFGLFTTISGQPMAAFGLGTGAIQNGASVSDPQAAGTYEVGFAYRPAVLTATQAAGGNLTALGVYSWVFVFEWSDPLGQRHRSAPSAPYTLTLTGGNQQVNFTITSLDWHQASNGSAWFPPAIVAYRTENGGTTYYRESFPGTVAGSSPSAFSLTGSVAYNSGSNAAHADASVRATEVLYTDGGVIENAMPPAAQFACRTDERLALGGQLDQRIITVSKIIVPGEPVQFTQSAAFDIPLPEPCTGLAYQDGAIVAFAKNAIYVITGDGPNDQGVGSFSPPRAISRDVGCIDYRSIVETAKGIFFQSERGIELLPRGFGVPDFIGMPLQASTALNPYCLGAAEFADTGGRWVQFLMSTTKYIGSGTSQQALVFVWDTELSCWSIDRYQSTRPLQAMGIWSAEGSARVAGPVFGYASLSSSVSCAYWSQRTAPAFDVGTGGNELILFFLRTAEIRPWGGCGWGSVSDLTLLYTVTWGSVAPAFIWSFFGDDAATQNGVVSWVPSIVSAQSRYIQLCPLESKMSSFHVTLSASHNQPSADGLGVIQWHGFQLNSEAMGARRTTTDERVQ